MNRESRKIGAATKSPAERNKSKSESSGVTSSLDDEFHEFFSKGDIGDYDGGVAYSQPPSKLTDVRSGEPAVKLLTPEQTARRAFFARVVSGVVAGCVMLLVVAAEFKSQRSTVGSAPAERVMAAQPALMPEQEPLLAPAVERPSEVPEPTPAEGAKGPPPVEEKPVVAALAPVDSVAVPPREEKPVVAALAPVDSVAAPPSPAKKIEDATPVPPKAAAKAVEAQPRRSAPIRSAKLARPISKSAAAVLPEVRSPVVSAPTAPKQSFAAFPVD